MILLHIWKVVENYMIPFWEVPRKDKPEERKLMSSNVRVRMGSMNINSDFVRVMELI